MYSAMLALEAPEYDDAATVQELYMNSDDPAIVLRQRLAKYLKRAHDALTDERLNPQDALAVARNVAATVTAEVDAMGASPTYS